MEQQTLSILLFTELTCSYFRHSFQDILFRWKDIQGDSGGICSTLGNDSMCDSKQKNSYEHGSDFERLPRYGKKKIRTILRARTAIT